MSYGIEKAELSVFSSAFLFVVLLLVLVFRLQILFSYAKL